MSRNVTHFRDLEVWRLAMSLAKSVYQLTRAFPASERYGLASQLQRAAVSIPSNVAEGNGRPATKDYARFVGMASGSTAELQTQLILARDLELARREDIGEALILSERVGRMLYRLRESLSSLTQNRSPVPGPESR